MEIDFVQLACTLLRKWKVIVLSTLVCALLAGGYVAVTDKMLAATDSGVQVSTSYTATANVYYMSTSLDIAESTGVNYGNFLLGDMQAFAVSRAVLEGAIDDLGLEMSYETLAKKVTAEIATYTHILTYTVVADDAQQAQDVIEALQVNFCDYVAQVMGVSAPVALEDVTITAQGSSGISSIGTAKGAATGALLGIVLSISGIFVYPIFVGFGKSVYGAMKKEA